GGTSCAGDRGACSVSRPNGARQRRSLGEGGAWIRTTASSGGHGARAGVISFLVAVWGGLAAPPEKAWRGGREAERARRPGGSVAEVGAGELLGHALAGGAALDGEGLGRGVHGGHVASDGVEG